VRDRWRRWLRRWRVGRITQQLIAESGYDVKTDFKEERYREQAREIADGEIDG